MNIKIYDPQNEVRLISLKEAADYLGVGDGTARKYLEEIQAVRRIGNRVVYDKKVIDMVLDKEISNRSINVCADF